MTYNPSHGVEKAGGDAANYAAQGASSQADVTNVAPGGAGIIAGKGGEGSAYGTATSDVDQSIYQDATGGEGGDDNVHADTNIKV